MLFIVKYTKENSNKVESKLIDTKDLLTAKRRAPNSLKSFEDVLNVAPLAVSTEDLFSGNYRVFSINFYSGDTKNIGEFISSFYGKESVLVFGTVNDYYEDYPQWSNIIFMDNSQYDKDGFGKAVLKMVKAVKPKVVVIDVPFLTKEVIEAINELIKKRVTVFLLDRNFKKSEMEQINWI